jgi:alpha-glucosidase
VNKWDDFDIGPDHDINIPFTRMLAGSTDYHLGGFRAVPRSKYKVQYTRPLMLGTRCHMLAMYVVLENYLQMVCDYPAAYEGQPGFEFIKEIPTAWDETKVPDAKIGEFITVARKKNNDWFVGSITNSSPRNISVLLNFLDEGKYIAEIYTDAPDANEHPNNLIKQTRIVKKQDVINLNLAAGGGEVMRLRKQ